MPDAALPPVTLPIRTERLILRAITLDDVPAMHEYQGDEEVCRYIPPVPRTPEQIAERITTGIITAEITEEGKGMTLGVVRRDTGEFIGDVLLFWRSAEHRGGELGYQFNRGHYGQGFATEAAAAMLAVAFDVLDFHRVIGRIDARNPASGRVLEKIGMRQEAYLRENEWFKGQWSDEIDFAILAAEWRAART